MTDCDIIGLMDKRRRMQIELTKETQKIYDKLAFDMGQELDDGNIGSATIGKFLLESLAAHPEMIEKLLAEYARKAGAVVQEFNQDEEGKRPFQARKR